MEDDIEGTGGEEKVICRSLSHPDIPSNCTDRHRGKLDWMFLFLPHTHHVHRKRICPSGGCSILFSHSSFNSKSAK